MTDQDNQRQPFNPNDHMDDLRGKSYLPVAARLMWIRDDAPDSSIHTELMRMDGDGPQSRAIFRAEITVIKDGEVKGKATGWGSETANDFGDYLEKAETKAVGRALAALGYGTQFALDLDEGERIVDSPQNRGGGYQQYGNQQPRQGAGQRPQRSQIATNQNGGNPNKASDAQIKMIRGMAGERGMNAMQLQQNVAQWTNGGDLDYIDKRQASAVIDQLKAIPNPESELTHN